MQKGSHQNRVLTSAKRGSHRSAEMQREDAMPLTGTDGARWGNGDAINSWHLPPPRIVRVHELHRGENLLPL